MTNINNTASKSISADCEFVLSFSKLNNSRLDLIENLYPEKGNLLDIGCGAGFFLNGAKERGWNCYGMEILSEYVKYAQKKFIRS